MGRWAASAGGRRPAVGVTDTQSEPVERHITEKRPPQPFEQSRQWWSVEPEPRQLRPAEPEPRQLRPAEPEPRQPWPAEPEPRQPWPAEPEPRQSALRPSQCLPQSRQWRVTTPGPQTDCRASPLGHARPGLDGWRPKRAP